MATLGFLACAPVQAPPPSTEDAEHAEHGDPVSPVTSRPTPSAGSTAVPVANAERTIATQVWPRVKRCYLHALETDPTQHGRIVILIKIDAAGTVADARITSNAGVSDGMAACAADAARQATFPPPGPGGASIAIPFNLVVGGPAKAPPAAAAPSAGFPPSPQPQADSIVQRIQALRDSVAASEAAHPDRECVRKSRENLDALLASARRMRRDLERDGPTASPDLVEHDLSLLRGVEKAAGYAAAAADGCP